MDRIRACSVGDLEPGDVVKVEVDPPIAVYNVDGEFYATDDTCTHGQSSLSDGWVDGDEIECAWHMARFCIRTGRAKCLPATVDLRTYQVIVEDGDIFVVQDAA